MKVAWMQQVAGLKGRDLRDWARFSERQRGQWKWLHPGRAKGGRGERGEVNGLRQI